MNLVDNIFSRGNKPFFILGPCVIESEEILMTIGLKVKEIRDNFNIPVVFKASFDKANRTSSRAYRGLGIKEGIKMLAALKKELNLPITTDIHESYQAELLAESIDIIQIPAFLCRQTDLLVEAAKTGRIINVKKGQFLSGLDMKFALDKILDAGNEKVMLTERGNMFGYNNLVVDFRNIPDMKSFGKPVVMDCTHSVQRPGGLEGKTGGNREFVPNMAYAAKAFGVDGYFFEIHPDPDNSPSDGPNMISLEDIDQIVEKLVKDVD